MKQNKAVIAAIIVLLLSVVFIIGLLHDSSKKEVTSRFQEQQLLHAHHLAEQIENFFNGHAQLIRAFSMPVSLQNES
ncbi:MAG: hypothetical protein FIA94_01590 [Nitrospirae bacterium]|nr:hypothetical protein [Nitrospirota bacterium]